MFVKIHVFMNTFFYNDLSMPHIIELFLQKLRVIIFVVCIFIDNFACFFAADFSEASNDKLNSQKFKHS